MNTEAQFNRYSIAVRDFEQAVAFALEAQKYSSATLAHEALTFAAIVAYYRPFTPNEKKQSVPAASQLTVEEFAPLSSGELALHEKCKTLRNRALAHSEYAHNPTRLDPSTGVISSRPFALLSHAPDLGSLAALAQKLADKCHHARADYVRRNAL